MITLVLFFPGIPDYNKKLSCIYDLIRSLPSSNQDTMKLLFGHLRRYALFLFRNFLSNNLRTYHPQKSPCFFIWIITHSENFIGICTNNTVDKTSYKYLWWHLTFQGQNYVFVSLLLNWVVAVTTVEDTEVTSLVFFPCWFHFPVLNSLFFFHNVVKINKADCTRTSRYINAPLCQSLIDPKRTSGETGEEGRWQCKESRTC